MNNGASWRISIASRQRETSASTAEVAAGVTVRYGGGIGRVVTVRAATIGSGRLRESCEKT